MKTCKKCGTEKELSGFYKRSSGSYVAVCKTCRIKETKARYYGPKNAEIKAKDRAFQLEKRQRIKDAVFAAYGGYKCACCGELEQKFLSLDHISNDGAQFRRSIAGNRTAAGYVTYRWLAKRGFPTGYQVLCMNCNHGKRMNGGVCPHLVRRNDQAKAVESSDSKRGAPILKVVG